MKRRRRANRRIPACAEAGSAAFELGDEEDFAALADRLVIGDVVDFAVDRDGGFLLQMLAEPGVAAIHLLDHVAQGLGFDLEFPRAAGVPAAETARQNDARGSDRHRTGPASGLRTMPRAPRRGQPAPWAA